MIYADPRVYSEIKRLQAEIDALVNALDDVMNHGKWDTYEEMCEAYQRGMALIAKHKGE